MNYSCRIIHQIHTQFTIIYKYEEISLEIEKNNTQNLLLRLCVFLLDSLIVIIAILGTLMLDKYASEHLNIPSPAYFTYCATLLRPACFAPI